MSKYLLLFLIVFSISILEAQPLLSTFQWQEDLLFLQERIHTDYSNLFHQISKEEFDAEVKALHEQIPKLEQHEIIVGLARIVSMLKIGHTYIPLNYFGDLKNTNTGFHFIPIVFYQFREGVYAQGLTTPYKKAIGARVVKIGKKINF